MRLKDKVAIVTGGSKGIGLGIAKEFIREGAKVVICSRNEEQGEAACGELKALDGDAVFTKCDVSVLDDLEMLVDFTVEKFGRLDIYVANAGINDPDKTRYLDITPEQYDRIMDVNLRGLFFGGQYAARRMARQGEGGVIINISSVNAYLALDSQMVYTTSKGAIQQLTKVQAVALAPYGIKVNAMAPGPIDTELMRRVGSDEQLYNTVISRTPIGRIGTPEECGRLAVFLASDDSDFIFGQSIYNDGGRSFQAFPVPGFKTVTEQDFNLLQEYKKGESNANNK
ncbi:SDR family oxidoreductase [Marispirochaeta aestuarii]|uniref:SDR family oxidoreductase n=1 Tax=Marispirochaeta aestuarii TaxID=1963862 RepID=A0A1Y1RUJ2_9SPIO|nr:SDR family oxidoreductase [Marispirochaeta aestuarii]ORC32718.1 SDR family oxidoreductase [Marispirochaeta aestuarii]